MINLHNIYGVAGKPILHSKSPEIFNHLKEKHFLFDSEYIRIVADSASEVVELMQKFNLKGINVTSPFKYNIMEYLDVVDEHAKIISAVNVVVNRDEKLFGYNTDHIGAVETIKKEPIEKNHKIIVIGSGGAGRAAAYGLVREGYNFSIINRTDSKAKEYSEKTGCKFAKWENLIEEINGADVIINTIPKKYINLSEYYSEGKYIFEADYSNDNIISGKQISGNEWLINQAIPSFQIFKGHDISNDLPEKELLVDLLSNQNSGVTKKNNIALIGFIGSGKTTVGRLLAEKLNWEFVDTDEIIIQKEEIPIREIFKEYGEPYFRQLEKDILVSLKGKSNMVISTGGGMILDDENRIIMKELCNIFWLYSPVDVCIKRLHSDLRPPLSNPFDIVTDPLERGEILFNYRIPYYCEVADALVYNNNSITETVNKIYEEVHTYFGY